MQRLQQPHVGTHMMEDTILVVEDDDGIGTLLADVLSQETPYNAMVVHDGWQALHLMRTVKPRLMITDYRLPLMDGIELYDRIHADASLADVPTIIMSAYMPEEKVKSRQLTSLHKPFELDDLLDTVGRLLQP